MHGRSRALDLFQHVAADSYFILHATKPDPSSDELGRMTSTAGAPRRCCLPSHVLHCKPARRRELHFVSTSGSSCVPKLADTWQLLGAFSLPEFQCAAHCRWGRPGPGARLEVHGQPGRGHAVRDPLCAAGAAGGAPPPHPPPLALEKRPRRAASPARAWPLPTHRLLLGGQVAAASLDLAFIICMPSQVVTGAHRISAAIDAAARRRVLRWQRACRRRIWRKRGRGDEHGSAAAHAVCHMGLGQRRAERCRAAARRAGRYACLRTA